ncbi:MAG: 4-hydroxythreonine-4-phosphate dehydrogenase PdxA [Sphingorhabdus sp.]
MTDALPGAPIAISAGDPAGIGPEIIGKAWEARAARGLSPFFAVGDAASFAPHWHGPVRQISQPGEALGIFGDALPLLQVHDGSSTTPGKPDQDSAKCAFQALEIAVGLARSGDASGVVTGPVSKARLYEVGFRHPGQTEFVAERCGVSRNNATMMLAAADLRVVPITSHIPLAEVAEALNSALIEDKIRATLKGLKRNFGISHPRLAIAGLNPHAGENGNIGREEIDLFSPVIGRLKSEGIDISGPLSADTLFHSRARSQYDAVLCGYHDQALIPIKTLYFDSAVNITLGLPIVRTSPDHGTAFNIAGKNIANADSMIAAIKMAADAALHRKAFDPA